MPASLLSAGEARSAQVAEHVSRTWLSWENRTRLDARNSTSWQPLHSFVDMMAKPPSTQSKLSTFAPSRQEEQLQPLAAHDQVANEGGSQQMLEGDLPSIGSKGHFDGSCKRCAFFPKGRCLNGKDCTHCHLPHETRPRNRKRRVIKADRNEDLQEEDEFLEESSTNADDFYPDIVEEHAETSSVPELVSAPLMTINEVEDIIDARDGKVVAKASVTAASRFAQGKGPSSESAHNDLGDTDSTSISSLDEAATTSSMDSEHDSSLMYGPISTCASQDISVSGSDLSLPMDSSATTFQADAVGADALEAAVAERNSIQSSPISWSAMRRKAGPEAGHAVDITRMTRALLNKLTEERFESLCSQVLALPLSTPEQLALLVKEIFHKATTQNGFRALYTELCMRLDVHLTAQPGEIGGKAFRKALVNECQATFERNLQPPEPSLFVNLNSDESFEMAMKLKTAILGNLRFIGDLLVRQLLSAKLLPPIVHTLLNGGEAELESLLALLEVIAPEFEGKPSLYQAPVNDAFSVLRQKVVQKSTCQRVRCRIQNLLDARARGWVPRSSSCE